MGKDYCGILSLDCEYCTEMGECTCTTKCEDKVVLEMSQEQTYLLAQIKQRKARSQQITGMLQKTIEMLRLR